MIYTWIAENTEAAIVDVAAVSETIRVGATRFATISQAVFGPLPEAVGDDVDRTVVTARGPEESAISIREALLERLVV